MRIEQSLSQLLEQSNIPLESPAGRQLTAYLGLLEKWNRRINLTSRMEWQVLGPMFEEGLWAASLYPAQSASHLDIGSGAGFPAIPLKILNPEIEMEMIDSREKKSLFLELAAHQLGLDGVRVHCARLSDFLKRCGENRHWDCISWKALRLSAADMLQLHSHAKRTTQFWMFHGRNLSWEDDTSLRDRFELIRKEKVPGMKDWNLSIYRPV